MEYLLDTNICIYIIKKKPGQVFEKLLSLSVGSVGISSITLAELQFGIAKSSNPKKNSEALEIFLTPIGVVEFVRFQPVIMVKSDTNLKRKEIRLAHLVL